MTIPALIEWSVAAGASAVGPRAAIARVTGARCAATARVRARCALSRRFSASSASARPIRSARAGLLLGGIAAMLSGELREQLGIIL